MTPPLPDGPSDARTVEHEPERSRFVVRADGATAVLDYRRVKDTLLFTHTEVPRGLEGRGIGAALARAGLEHVREHGLTAASVCPFVNAFLKRHPEYDDLIRLGRGGGARP